MNQQANYKVRLELFADTKSAAASLNSLNQQLNNIVQNLDISKGMTPGINKAKNAIVSLQTAMKQAVNVDTGSINFDRLNSSLRNSGHTIQSLGADMAKMGVQGIRAFGDFAKTAAQAQIPLRSSSTIVSSLMNTLGNTIKWQLASKAINMVTGSLRKSIQFAKDLDKVLTDISIVSELSRSQLQAFATEANKAARELGASTKEYMEASVIFFQQGLDIHEVKERTDAVIKMTKVTGESASKVSSYMTAIWNNFDNGSKSLEYYADVITALGAATASSSEEIAGGLEKFASIAETVGLSYEYATAALATVVAETRQSEDTVGTSFKTIFGRLQSLSLGESLEDDTTLTKYSNALLAVGVNIKDSNGELKKMDDILDELGAKWDTLNKDQQIALAYTVAGTRQYNNFIALMDSYSSSFTKNLAIAQDAENQLDKQLGDYKEGWESTRKVVQSSMENIYNSFFNEEFFKDMNKFITPLINGVALLVKGMGGFNTIVPMLTTFFLTVLNDKVVRVMQDISYNFSVMTGAAQKRALAFKEAAADVYQKQAHGLQGRDTEYTGETGAYAMHADLMKQRNVLANKLFELNGKISAEAKTQLETDLRLNEELDERILKYGKLADEAQRAVKDSTRTVLNQAQGKPATITGAKYDTKGTNGAIRGQLVGSGKAREAWAQSGILNKKEHAEQAERIAAINKELLAGVKTQEEFNKKVQEAITLEEQLNRAVAQKNIINNNSAFQSNLQVSGMVTPEARLNDNVTSTDNRAVYAAAAGNTIQNLQEKQKLYLQSQGLDPEKDVGYDQTSQKLETLIQQLTKFKNKMDVSDISVEDLKTSVQDFNNTLNQASTPADQLTQEFIEQQTAVTGDAESAKVLAQDLRNVAENNVLVINNTQAANKHLRDFNQALTQAGAGVDGFAQKLVTAASGAMSLLTAINSIKNIKNIINDDSLSGFEKFTSLAMTSLMSFMSVMTFLNSTSKVIQGLKKKTDTEDLAAKQRSTNSLYRLSHSADHASRSLRKGGNKGKGNVNAPKGKVDPKTVNGDQAAQGAGKAAVSMGWIALAIVAIVAATAAIVSWYNKAENKAKKYEKAAQKAGETAKETRNKFAELQETISKYDKSRDAIDNMIKGTEEWKKAIADTNEQAKELIKNYKSIDGIDLKYKVDENGVIQIEEESLKQIEAYKQQQVLSTELMALGTEQRAQMARQEADLIKFQRKKLGKMELGTAESWKAAGIGALGGLGAGASIGAMVSGGYGALIGAAIGGVTGLVAGGLGVDIAGTQSKDENKAIERISDSLRNMSDEERAKLDTMDDTQYKNWLRSQGIANDKLIEDLAEHRGTIEELIDEEKANREALIANTQAIISQTVGHITENAANKSAVEALIAARQVDNKYRSDIVNEIGALPSGGNTRKEWAESLTDDHFRITKAGGNKAKLEIKDGDKYVEYAEGEISWDEIYELVIDYRLGQSMEKMAQAETDAMNDAVNQLAFEFNGSNKDTIDDTLAKFFGQAYSDALLGQGIDVSSLGRSLASQLASSNLSGKLGAEIKQAVENYDEYIRTKNKKATTEWLENSEARVKNARIEAQKTLELSDESYEAYTAALMQANDQLANQADLTSLVATRNLELINSFNTLYKTLKDNIQDLASVSNHLSTTYLKALGKVQKAFQEAFGVSVNEAFIESYLEDIVKASEGDQGALINVLKGINEQRISQDKDLLDSEANTLKDIFVNEEGLFNTQFKQGQTLATSKWGQAIRDLITSGSYSSENMTKLLTNAGFMVAYDAAGNIDLLNTTFQGFNSVLIDNESLLDKEYNTLYLVNKAVAKQKTLYDELTKTKDKTFGQERIDAINAERDALIALNEEIEKENSQLAKDRAKKQAEMNQYFEEHDIKLTYDDETKEIIGFTDLKTGQSHKGSNWYDILMGEKFQHGNDEAEGYINAYDDLTESINENNKEIQDNTNTIQEYDFEKLEYAITNAQEKISLSLDKLTHQLKQFGDSYLLAEARGNVYEEQADTQMKSFVTNYGGFLQAKQLLETNANDAEAQKQLKTYYDGMLKDRDALIATRDSMRDNFVKAIEDGTAAIEKQKDIIDVLSDTLNKYTEVVDLLGSEVLDQSAELKTLLQENTVKSAKEALQAEIAHKKTIDDNLAHAKTMYQEYRALGDEQGAYWQEHMQELEKQSLDSANTILDAYLNALEAAQTLFTLTVDNAIASMQQVLAGDYGSFDYMIKAQETKKELNDLFLAEYEQTYELNKLKRQIATSIDSTSDVTSKRELRELEQRINAAAAEGNDILGDKKNLMQEQVDLMQKEYEITLARIALEDAQNSKTQVQLQQNSAGMWTYVYTADKEAIDAAQQTLEDKMYELDKLKTELNEKWMNEIVNLEKAFGDEIKTVLDMEFESTDAQMAAIEEVVENTLFKLKTFTNVLGTLGDANADTMYSSISTQITTVLHKILGAYADNQDMMAEISALVAGDETIEEFIKNGASSASTRSTEALNNTIAQASSLKTVYAQLANQLVVFEEKYKDVMTNISEATEDAATEISKLYDAVADVTAFAEQGLYVQISTMSPFSEPIASGASGMYTGEWGSEGKLAVLHEKELVLNKDDTKNMLKMLDMVRGDYLQKLSLSAPTMAAKANQYESIIAAMMDMKSPQTLEQQVSIQAEFPNAIYHDEIAQAFDNIIGMASQYAAKK